MGILTGPRRRWRSEPEETPDPRRALRLRFWLLRLGIVAAFAALTVQLARLQLVNGSEYEQRASLNQLRSEPEIPSRGLIYDRNGVPVVENVPSFSAGIVAADIPEERQLEIVGALERVLGVSALETSLMISATRTSKDPFTPVILRDGLTAEEAFFLREQLGELPGVQVIVEPVRRYTAGIEMSHILGYIGRIDEEEYDQLASAGYVNSDRLGKTGVEAAYEEYLRGTVGQREIEKDALGREIRTISENPAIPGNNLTLSIDLDLQKKVTELTKQVSGGYQAVAVVMDVNTGELLALVSLPEYDNNAFSGKTNDALLESYLSDPNKPLVNHALAEQYAPGSIFKQVTGAAALQERVAYPSTTITSNGFINVPREYDESQVDTFKDWQALGPLDFYGGIAMSSDVYFYYLAGGYHWYGEDFDGLGVERLARYARQFGLGRPTGIDIAGEAPGVVPDAEWKAATFQGDDWFLGDTYNFAIGQGYLAVTPIQMARVVAAVANGGTLLTPHVVREIRDADGRVVMPAEPRVEGSVGVSEENLAIVRDAMRQAVTWGTAKDGGASIVSVAGKTGTAEFGQQFADGNYLTHAWFSGFAPYENPEIAVTVFLEQGVGATNAAPLASRIFQYYFEKKQEQAQSSPSGSSPAGVQQGVTP